MHYNYCCWSHYQTLFEEIYNLLLFSINNQLFTNFQANTFLFFLCEAIERNQLWDSRHSRDICFSTALDYFFLFDMIDFILLWI